MYDLNRMSADMAEADIFADDLQPILSALEASSGCILVDEMPAIPLESLGLTVQKHLGGSVIIGYNMQMFALLKLSGLFYQSRVFESLLVYLHAVRPTSKNFFIEVSLFTEIFDEGI